MSTLYAAVSKDVTDYNTALYILIVICIYILRVYLWKAFYTEHVSCFAYFSIITLNQHMLFDKYIDQKKQPSHMHGLRHFTDHQVVFWNLATLTSGYCRFFFFLGGGGVNTS